MPSIAFEPCPIYGRAEFAKCDACQKRCHPLPVLKSMMGSREIVPGQYSTTEILKPLQATYLSRHNDFAIDPLKTIFMVNGTAVHSVLEEGGKDLDPAMHQIEQPFKEEVLPGVFLTGRPDYYEVETGTLLDFKNSKAYTVKKYMKAAAEKAPWLSEDYFAQLNIYRAFAYPEAKRLTLYFFVQGWTKRDEGIKAIEQVDAPMGSMAEVRLWVKNRLQKIVEIEKTGVAPECKTGDLWIRADGVPVRCAEYCNARAQCQQAKRLMAGTTRGGK